MSVDGTGEGQRAQQWASAEIIAEALPRFEHNVVGETLVFLKPATRFARFARFRDSDGRAYRRGERHRCWTVLHPRARQLHPVVLLDTGHIGYVNPPEGIDQPDGTYLSFNPLRRWDPTNGSAGAPAADLLRNYLEGALTRYLNIEPGQDLT